MFLTSVHQIQRNIIRGVRSSRNHRRGDSAEAFFIKRTTRAICLSPGESGREGREVNSGEHEQRERKRKRGRERERRIERRRGNREAKEQPVSFCRLVLGNLGGIREERGEERRGEGENIQGGSTAVSTALSGKKSKRKEKRACGGCG